MNKKDYLIMAVLTVIYAVIAFSNLGATVAPETFWQPQSQQVELAVDFGETYDVSRVQLYPNIENASFEFATSIRMDSPGEDAGELEKTECFQWFTVEINKPARYVVIRMQGRAINVGEITFFDGEQKPIPVRNILGTTDQTVTRMFDEADKAPFESDYYHGTYFDEIYHARTAYEFINHLLPYEITHPPLGKVIISLGIRMFGMTPFGWRFMGTLFGVLMVPLMYLLGKRLFKKTFFAAAASILFTFDFMHFAQTRIATIDTYAVFFIMLMYLFLYEYMRQDYCHAPMKKMVLMLGLCGLFFGLGAATKWTCLYAGAGLAVLFFIDLFCKYRRAKKEAQLAIFKGRTLRIICWCLLFFIVVPVLIYAASYAPLVACEGQTWQSVINNQSYMFDYHSGLKEDHPYSSKWYEWIVMVKPIVFYRITPVDHPDQISTIASFGNPLVWWVGILAMLYLFCCALYYRDKKAWFIFIAYLAQLLPWMLVSRVVFIYHYFNSVPFLVLAIVYAITRYYEKNPKRCVAVTSTYLAGCVALFALFYPVLSGLPAGVDYVRDTLIWFKQWYFV